jgi:hypothetical protein
MPPALDKSRRVIFGIMLLAGMSFGTAVITACVSGHDGGGAATPTSRKDLAATSVAAIVPVAGQLTTSELRAMLPTKAEFRRLVQPSNDIWIRSFKAVSNRRAPAGRSAGYQGDFWNACGGVCRPGLVDLSATVDVFGTTAQASQFIADQVKHNRESVGKASEFARLENVELFAPSEIGDESVGLRTKTVLLKEPGFFSATVILFRTGSIVGLASTNAIYRKDTSNRAVALANLLEKRISSVLGTTYTP